MSEIRANTVSDAAGTGPATLTGQSAAKAWVNLDGTGTIATRDSFNVASLTDNGTGDYAVNLTNSMSNSDYVTNGTTHAGVVFLAQSSGVLLNYTASSLRAQASNVNAIGTLADKDACLISTHGDLA